MQRLYYTPGETNVNAGQGESRPNRSGSRGAGDGIRTHDTLLGKQMRYHCATPAFVV